MSSIEAPVDADLRPTIRPYGNQAKAWQRRAGPREYSLEDKNECQKRVKKSVLRQVLIQHIGHHWTVHYFLTRGFFDTF